MPCAPEVEPQQLSCGLRRMKRILMISTHGYVETKPSFGLPDTGALAQAILRLLRDKALSERLSQQGYEKAHSMFTWAMIAQSTLKEVRQ